MEVENSEAAQKSLQQEQDEFLKNVQKKVLAIGENKKISYVQNIFSILKSSHLPFALTEKDDIIKDIYEGGFKVWECTIDLLQYLQKTGLSFKGKSVMDLGCGHGLLGIYALQEDAQCVLFQDYNYEVLSIAVRLNLSLNQLTDIKDRLIYVSGEWNDLAAKVQNQTNEVAFIQNKLTSYDKQFDILMLSEVIYNTANYEKIAQLILNLMKPSGVCLLANKLYYFGVGGSMLEFKQYIAKNYAGSLVLESLEIVNNKMGNKREIVSIRKI